MMFKKVDFYALGALRGNVARQLLEVLLVLQKTWASQRMGTGI
jgi:hypothetical protein